MEKSGRSGKEWVTRLVKAFQHYMWDY